ncbi:MAG TPA: hypothetical protein VMV49_06070 [Candidatus Deferrimicrobium sp.]|nr:hypothetical protein [Candidatus Deferrimicrobium sp.]
MEITTEDREKAITYLMTTLPDDTIQKVSQKIHEEGEGYLMELHHGFGTQVRNLLRKGGFHWGAIVLDNEWDSLVLEAVKRKLQRLKNNP